MPQFNVLRINQTHLAKVIAAKSKAPQTNEVADNSAIVSFMRWRNYIRKQLTSNKTLTSSLIVHTIE